MTFFFGFLFSFLAYSFYFFFRFRFRSELCFSFLVFFGFYEFWIVDCGLWIVGFFEAEMSADICDRNHQDVGS